MDLDSLLIECALFTAKFCVSCFLYKLYKTNAECLKSLKEAQHFEIDNELQKKVEKNDGIIKYAVISGSIKALSVPIRSQYISYLQGVIREKVTKEHKVKWSPFLRIWSSANHDLQHTINYVPFALCSKTSGLFKKQICVEVIEPLTARELILPEVYDEFISHHDTIGDAVVGFFRGERTIGVQEVERMLCEGETLTAVGKLIIENSKLKIKQPDNGFKYFLTPLTIESLINKVHANTRLSKVGFIIMGTLTFSLFIYISRHAFAEIKRKIIRNREKKRLDEQRKLRRMADKSRGLQDINIPKCVICLDYPVEVLILECGHACLCYDCSERVKSFCPVCRNPIVRTVPAFWP